MSRNPAAMKRQADGQAAALAYRRCTAVCADVEGRIEAFGADGLADWCARYVGESYTVKTAILGLVLRKLGKEARNDVREVLP